MRALHAPLVLFVLSCASCRLLGWGDPWADVQGVSWELSSVEGTSPTAGRAEIEIRLQFDEGGRLFGEVGAVPYFGSYARSGRNGLRIGKIGSARPLHPTEPGLAGERFLALLGESDAFSVREGCLSLSCRGAEVLRFVQGE